MGNPSDKTTIAPTIFKPFNTGLRIASLCLYYWRQTSSGIVEAINILEFQCIQGRLGPTSGVLIKEGTTRWFFVNYMGGGLKIS